MEKVFQDAAKAAIGGDRKHGWGLEDSAEVIETIIAEDAKDSKYTPSDEAMKLIRLVINPSQARQAFEAAGLLDESKQKRTSKGLKALMQQVG